MFNLTTILKGLRILRPDTLTPDSIEIVANGAASTKTTIQSSQTADRTITLPNATDTLVGRATTDVLTNKNIDADLNTITNIDNNGIKALAGIDATKIGAGTVDNTEFGYLNGVLTPIQTQLDNNAANLAAHLADPTDAHDASAISVVPSGNILSTNVQAALEELDEEITSIVAGVTPEIRPATYFGTPGGTLPDNSDIVFLDVAQPSYTVTLPANPSEGQILKIIGQNTEAGSEVTVVANAGQIIEGSVLPTVKFQTGFSIRFESTAWILTNIYQRGNISGDVVGTSDTQTLTNKTISTLDNTIGSGASPVGYVLTADGAGSSTFQPSASVAKDSSYEISNLGLATSFNGTDLTFSVTTKTGATPSLVDPVYVGFRDSTATSGEYALRTINSALSLTLFAGSTLGMLNGSLRWVSVYLIDNMGTPELAVSFTNYGDGIISTTAEGPGTATNAQTVYSLTARTNVPARLVGRVLLPGRIDDNLGIDLLPAQRVKTPTMQVITAASFLYILPSDANRIKVRMIGAGGGAGGSGASAAAAGTNGGSTTFGAASVGGGQGGTPSNNAGGLGGTVSSTSGFNSVVARSGSDGDSASSGRGGSGGASPLGGNGGGLGASGATGRTAKANTGSGGGGTGNSTVNGPGGGSGAYIEGYINFPNSSYSGLVGVGGPGSVGTSGTGGAGASGVVIVEEYYD